MRSFHLASLFLFLAYSLGAATTPAPVIVSLNPSAAVVGSAATDIVVTGANFQAGAVVKLNGVSRSTAFTDASHLTAHLNSGDFLTARTFDVTVTNPGIINSTAVTFEVFPNAPAINTIDPSVVGAGSANVTLTVDGTNFASSAVVRLNAAARTTTWVSSSRLTATIPSSDLTAARSFTVTVLNPSNKISNGVTLTVATNATPTITLLSPTTVKAGSKPFTLSIAGNNFVSGSVVRAGSRTFSTTFVDAQHLTIPVLASDVATAGSLSLTVTNPGNLTSAAVTLPITSATLPTITALSPTSALAGGQGFTLTVTGENYVSGMTLTFGGLGHTTKLIDSQHLTTTIQRTEITTAGQIAVTVSTPGSSPETSLPFNFTVVSANAPVITSLTPATVASGSAAFKMLINGTGFVQNDVARLNGDPRTTEFVSVTQLAATIPSTDLVTPAEIDVTVVHPTGEISAPATFTISDAAAPIIDSTTPQSANVGDSPFTLTVSGSNFTPQSIVTFDDVARATSFVDSSHLTVSITSADLATARTFTIAVRNAGGATSNEVTLIVALQVPVISQLSPTSAIAGDTDFTLTVSGSNFGSNAIVNVNGMPRATSFEPATGRITTTINAADVAAPGSLNITVTDHGVTSPVTKLTVARPAIITFLPVSVRAGGSATTVTITASSFLSTSRLVVNNEERTTTSDPAAGTLTTTLTAEDIANPGAIAVNVRNGAQATSPAVFITIVADPPRLDSITPSTLNTGSGLLRLHLFGANFLTGSQVQVGGDPRATTYVSSTELIVDLQPSDVSSTGTLVITVVNQDGVVSNQQMLTVVFVPGDAPVRRRAASH
jgi:hypothetical protein